MDLLNIKTLTRFHGICLFTIFMAGNSMRAEADTLEVYKWIDQYGVTHYSAEAPQEHEKATATMIRLVQQPWGEAGPINRSQNYLPLLELAKELEQSRLARERLRREKARLARERLSAEKAARMDCLNIQQQDRVYTPHSPPYYGYYRFPFPRRYSHCCKHSGLKRHERHSRRLKSISTYKGYRGFESPRK